ncbi:MAG: hypothetical protein E6970_02060 [Peptostreptococcus sp.]|jgi:hypothetical protein|uniref:hypothetical protein n=1 Tax=Peptostreptococcus sp. TaxID=1262 RepID=UPI001DFC79C2|nr:hypothetical protein [Peptostreptococcus sp.]MBS5596605.1 hypothetical protein [Peptostreptococcus sp.]MDU1264590.1 hypothetical protein [Peptostreptococcus sp.]
MASKKIKARVLFIFEDIKDKTTRKPGEIFETTKTRLNEINKSSNDMFGKDYVEEVSEDTKENKEEC